MSIDIKENKSSIQSKYRPEIDGLRAFAIITVIINHFNKDILPGGYLGVDIFFVISGFVITSSLYQRPSKNFKDFISGFYERRIKRLVPALSIFVVIMSIAICLFNPVPVNALRTGLTSLFGMSNLYLLKYSTDYFAQSTKLNVFTHTWSLGIEEQFYIIYPFLIWFSGFGRQTKHGARNLLLIIGTLSIISLIGFLYLYPSNQPAAYFLMPTRFWEMATGCLIFLGFQKRVSFEKFLERIPPNLVLILIVSVMYLPISFATSSTIAVVALSVVLIASLKKGTALYTFLTNPKIVYVGLISYSLYLWHWGILSISRWTIGIHWWTVPFQMALILGLAVGSYRYIEKPLRNYNWFEKRWKRILCSSGVIIILSGGIFALEKHLKGIFYTGKFDVKDFIWVQDGMECELFGNAPTLEPLKCIDDDFHKNTIYLFGDSHASNLVRIAENSLQGTKYDNVKYLTNFQKANTLGPSNWYENRDLDKILSKTSKNDLIIWSNQQKSEGDPQIYSITKQLDYLENLSERTSVPVLVINDIISFGEDINFLPKFSLYRNGPSLSIEEASKDRDFFTRLLLKFTKTGDRIYYFDPLPHLCPENLCKSVNDDQLIYADDSPHFSTSKAPEKLLSEPLRKKLLEISNSNKSR